MLNFPINDLLEQNSEEKIFLNPIPHGGGGWNPPPPPVLIGLKVHQKIPIFAPKRYKRLESTVNRDAASRSA